MEAQYNTEQQQQYQLHNTKEIKDMCQHRHDLSPTIGNGTQTKVPAKFPNHYTSMLSANTFCNEDKPKQPRK
jgi:hypothetical protein